MHGPPVQQQKVQAPATLNPNPVIKPTGRASLGGTVPDSKLQKMSSSVDKQRELLQKLKEERERTERELAQNQVLMEQKVQSLVDERQQVERLILGSTITIQRFARGFITRLKLKNF